MYTNIYAVIVRVHGKLKTGVSVHIILLNQTKTFVFVIYVYGSDGEADTQFTNVFRNVRVGSLSVRKRGSM